MRSLRSAAVAIAVIAALAGPAMARGANVRVFPIPGSRVASPETQIVFRGVSVSRLGSVTVAGSRTGRHTGRIIGDSDGNGASFLPSTPFKPGETVTVTSRQTILGGSGDRFHFRVAVPAGTLPTDHVTPLRRQRGDAQYFHSRPNLQPVAIKVLANSLAAAPGDIFLGPQVGPVQNGPMILDPNGQLVWFAPVPAGAEANNVRVQTYRGRPVLTWWEGYLDLATGAGIGDDVILDSSYHRIATVQAANGLSADLHEFELTSSGTALLTAFYPVYWDARSVHGGTRNTRVLDAVIQEIDIRTGLVLFQWDSLDHVPLSDSEVGLPSGGQPYDYFHVNSVHTDSDGDLIVSARNTWAAYKIDREDGTVLWTLGGKLSSFAMGPGASFAFQHDVRVDSADDGTVSVFDDGSGPPHVHSQSRALVLRLDTTHHAATVVSAFTHSPALLASFEGGLEPLSDGDSFVGWGQQPYFTEFSPTGQVVFDARFADGNTTYRALRFPWVGTPHTAPAVAASSKGTHTTVYASWNGDTQVAGWVVLSGPSPKRLTPAGLFAKTGFETTMRVTRRSYVAVRAYGANGRLLGTSYTIRPS